MPTVSVVVPVYRAQDTITRCVTAIKSQTYTDWELILVDDASPDDSGDICDRLAATDKRMCVIHKEKNEGAAAARNTGLETAVGRYVAFCDSDDTVSPLWLERLIACAKDGVLPMCSYPCGEEELGCEKSLSIPSAKELPITEYYRFWEAGIAGFLCNALYDNGVIGQNGLRLREQHDKGDYNEDLLFALQYVRHMDRIVYTGYADYRYDTREGSLSTSQQARTFYFEKYAEKYRLWKAFLLACGEERQLPSLCTTMLYHALVSLQEAPYREFATIVRSDMMQECVASADCSRENPRVIDWIKRSAVNRLWLLYQLQALKGRLST